MFIHHQALHYLSADVLTFKFKFLSCLRSSGTIERVVQNISTISVRGINVFFPPVSCVNHIAGRSGYSFWPSAEV